MRVALRPLQESDALISYVWRNNPEIWRYTGARPDRLITQEMELTWIREVLTRKNERRYAILVDDKYVGNVQLTDIEKSNAQLHIFIGETSYWGRGVASDAIKTLLEISREEINLKELYVHVNPEHKGAIKVYAKVGFVLVEKQNDGIFMTCKL